MLEIMPSSKIDDGSARLKKAVNKELFIARCRNRLQGKKNLKKYLPERFSFLYQFLWNQMPSNIYENIVGKLNKSDQEFKTKVISSMVPDEVLYNPTNYKTTKFMSAVMFVDVSGFTDLSELYNTPGKGGASKLSQVLNAYLGGIVHEILSHGGDVLKFSGDAMLVLFKATASVSLPDAIHRAVDTAIMIQLSFGRYKTDVGVMLQNKIAISAGEVHFSLVGTETFSHYVVVGHPVWKVKLAEKIALAGDIIITHYAWSFMHDNEYVSELCPDKTHLKVKGFTSYWRSTKRLNFAEGTYRDNEESDEPSEKDDTIKINNEMLAIRPRLKYVTNHFVASSLQKFLIKPVLNAVENNESLELLTEMRQIVTVFLNIVLRPRDVVEIIKNINSIFTTVCDIVQSYEGIVNKVSLFDKDVMFLIIFGLRGLKHEMDSQLALHCACEIQEMYAKNPYIISASIGVTTGTAYCGIVGHTVRREYSAIGVDVNKAARLMMAYPHKVTCDKTTFMMSKLDPAHFTLQDAIQLKGLHNVGPIYEYREFIAERELLKPMVYNYPLVDRDQFFEIFQEMIEDALMIAQQTTQGTRSELPKMQWYQNCLLIQGKAQMGKTRLANEFFYIALRNKHISSLCFSLSLKDSKKPFFAASLCLSRPLGFTETITTITRQNRIKQYLREHGMEQHLSLLNEILGTNFIETDATSALLQTERDSVRKDLFKYICQKTFQNLWVLIIDDAEFIDDESFDLFEILWEMPQIITVLTVGNQKRHSPARVRILDSPYVCQVKLPQIETLLHKAVACQFLNVNAIPLDLERHLHTLSNGNPGWINTFLLCLRQSGILRIKRMGYSEAQAEGYVFCESALLQRDSMKSSSSTYRPSLSDWRLFESSFEIDDSMHYNKDQPATLFNKIVDVAYLTSPVDTKDYQSSQNQEAFNLMLYDSLSAFEQLVCKCAAFLGQKFLRASLMYTMATESEWDVAVAMKKLFDLQIVSCAIGDFSDGFRLAQKNVNSDWLGPNECACIALDIGRSCKDLPKYAVCGYSKFKSSEFHKTVYNLVTETQKKLYHSNALEFIETEAKKCNSCGGTPFKNLLSTEETYEIQTGCRRSELSDVQEILNQQSTSRFSLYSSQQSTIFECCDRRVNPSRQAPVLSYGAYSFTSCNCNMILYTVFSKIVRHSKGAGMVEKCIEAKIEWAKICIKLGNIPKAIAILDKVQKMMTQINTTENIAVATYLKGRMYTMMAKGKFHLEQYDRALKMYYKAAKTLGMSFPRQRFLVRLKSSYFLAAVKRILDPSKVEKRPHRKGLFYSLIVSQISSCFNGMHKLFVRMNDWDRAELAAVWGLKHALRYRKSSGVLVKAFANFFLTAYHAGFSENIAWIQEQSLAIVAENVHRVDADYLNAVVRYYTALFLCQTLRSKKLLSIELGKVVLQITDRLLHQSDEWVITPILCELLLSNRRIAETVQTLWNLQKLILSNHYRTGDIWYYAISLDVLLDTSCCIESYQRCENFYFKNRESFLAQKYGFASARLFANLWLWCVRYGAWVAADNWLSLLREHFALTAYDSTININTAIRIVEGMVLTLIYHIEARNTVLIRRVRAGIEALLASIEQALGNNKNHVAKYELMRIYYRQVVTPDLAATNRALAAVAKRAQMRNDHLCYDHVKHTLKFWQRELTPALETFWLDHAAGSDRVHSDGAGQNQSFNAGSSFEIGNEQLYDYASCILNHERIYPYSMPLPRARFR